LKLYDLEQNIEYIHLALEKIDYGIEKNPKSLFFMRYRIWIESYLPDGLRKESFDGIMKLLRKEFTKGNNSSLNNIAYILVEYLHWQDDILKDINLLENSKMLSERKYLQKELSEIEYSREALKERVLELYGEDTEVIYLYSVKFEEYYTIFGKAGYISLFVTEGGIETKKVDNLDFDLSLLRVNRLIYFVDRLYSRLSKFVEDKKYEGYSINEVLNSLEESEEGYLKILKRVREIKETIESIEEILKTERAEETLASLLQPLPNLDTKLEYEQLYKAHIEFSVREKYELVERASEIVSKHIEVDRRAKRVVFCTVADAGLFPLHTLKRDGKFLIETTPILYAPSLSILKKERYNSDERVFIKVDDGDRIAEQVEIDREHFDPDRVFEEKERFIRYADTNIIDSMFFATHGEANLDPLDSTLQIGNELLTARELLDKNIRVNSLIVSACEGHISPKGVYGIDTLLGFTSIFIAKGTQSVVTTSVKIGSIEISYFMKSFHKYRLEMSFAEAMQKLYIDALNCPRTKKGDLLSRSIAPEHSRDRDSTINREWFFIVAIGR
jgi:hypothetical protein